MPLISKLIEIQINLSSMFDSLHNSVTRMRAELQTHRDVYELACLKHIESGYKYEKQWLNADKTYHKKFLEFETYCFLLDILSDYQDEDGIFIHLEEITSTLESLRNQFEKQEAYEVCAIIKKWLDHVNQKHQIVQI